MIRFLILPFLLFSAPLMAADLPRSQIVVPSVFSVDPVANTVVMPLYRGEAGGKTVWYIVTDSSDKADAARRGVVHAPLLTRVGHVQEVRRQGERLIFPAAPDFSPPRRLTVGPQGFPPAGASPGATALAGYSPFIRIAGETTILNAPIVAVGDGPFDVALHGNVMDRVLAIEPQRGRVTLLLSHGFAEGRAVVYISTEASDEVAAVLERATYVPRLGEGEGDIGLLAIVNGQRGTGNAQAQGLSYVLLDGRTDVEATLGAAAQLGSARNILTAFPTGKTASGYSPLWSVTPVVWNGAPGPALKAQADIYKLAAAKTLTGPHGAPMQPAGFVVNCPVIAWLDAAP